MEHIFHNLHFWLITAFIITVILLYKKISNLVNAILTQQIQNIAQDIKESKTVYNQSFSLINEKKEQLRNLINYKNQFITDITSKANTYYEILIDKLEKNLHKSKKNFNDYLKHNENLLITKESNKVLNESIINVTNIIKNNATNKHQIKFIDNSIKNIESLINQDNVK